MTRAYQTFGQLLDLSCGRLKLDGQAARRSQLVIAACLASLVFASLWGLAAGCKSFGLATRNLYKVPMVVLFSSLSAIPAGLLALKLSGSSYRPSRMLMSFLSSVFCGTLVLAVLAPLVAVYYLTSTWAGPYLATGSIGIALLVAMVLFSRSALSQRAKDHKRRHVVMTLVVFVIMAGATMLQLVALLTPFLPENTAFSGGIDQLGQVR